MHLTTGDTVHEFLPVIHPDKFLNGRYYSDLWTRATALNVAIINICLHDNER